jgi:hypothetical protein
MDSFQVLRSCGYSRRRAREILRCYREEGTSYDGVLEPEKRSELLRALLARLDTTKRALLESALNSGSREDSSGKKCKVSLGAPRPSLEPRAPAGLGSRPAPRAQDASEPRKRRCEELARGARRLEEGKPPLALRREEVRVREREVAAREKELEVLRKEEELALEVRRKEEELALEVRRKEEELALEVRRK